MSEVRQGWFRSGYDYDEILERLKKDFEKKPTPSKAIALIIASNGCRVSEAIEAYSVWLKTGNTKPRVRVRKRGWDRKTHQLVKPVYRLIVIPSAVVEKREVLKKRGAPSPVAVWKYLKKYGINPHTLRYLFITYMIKRGIREAMIAQLTGHAKLDTLAKYVIKIEAEKLLEMHVEKLG